MVIFCLIMITDCSSLPNHAMHLIHILFCELQSMSLRIITRNLTRQNIWLCKLPEQTAKEVSDRIAICSHVIDCDSFYTFLLNKAAGCQDIWPPSRFGFPTLYPSIQPSSHLAIYPSIPWLLNAQSHTQARTLLQVSHVSCIMSATISQRKTEKIG